MRTARILPALLICIVVFAVSVFAENQVRVFVPADQFHAEGELVVGIPGDIYVEVTNDVELGTVALSMALIAAGGGPQLAPMVPEDVEYILPPNYLMHHLMNVDARDGNLPDTLNIVALKILEGEFLPPGTHNYVKITVTPTQVGTIRVIDENHRFNGYTAFQPTSSQQFSPDFVAPDITVIGPEDCNDNGVPDDQDLALGTSSDCNGNGVPDECDVASGLQLDCIANEVLVYVPADQFHVENELVVGIPGYVYMEVANDAELDAVVVTVALSGTAGLEPFTTADIEHLLPAGQLTMHLDNVDSDGNLPDTANAVGIKLTNSESLPPGRRNFARLKITPTAAGNFTVANETHSSNGPTNFAVTGVGETYPTFIGTEINVVGSEDCNNNGIPDLQDLTLGTSLDCNGNGYPDECDIDWGTEFDCNSNGVPDACDLAAATSADCNANLIPDECDPDLNSNGVPDDCETGEDCNLNGIADALDVVSGWSNDVNANGVPDECEGLAGNFFRIFVAPNADHGSQELIAGRSGKIMVAIANDVEIEGAVLPFRFSSHDGTPLWELVTQNDAESLLDNVFQTLGLEKQGGDWPDSLLILQVFGPDHRLPVGFHPFVRLTVLPTAEGTVSWEVAPAPSLLEPAQFTLDMEGTSIDVGLEAEPIAVLADLDCNSNGIPDTQELSGNDCNGNGILDECEISGGQAEDCNLNGLPDECDLDLNANGIPDDCETFVDCNGNGVTDADDIFSGWSADTNANGVPDECEGLEGNYLKVYLQPDEYLEGQPLEVWKSAHIVWALVNDVPIEGAYAPVRFSSGDGTPLWETITEDAFASLLPNDYEQTFTFVGGAWPDTVSSLQLFLGDNVLPVGCHPVLEMTVTPTNPGTVSWELAPVPTLLEPASFVPSGGGDIVPITLKAASIEIVAATDCNQNGILDLEEIADRSGNDCNRNDVLDECEIAYGEVEDCNGNGVPDECDYDLNVNGIPDDCEGLVDCNFNGVPDADDIAWGNSADANSNGIPDECEGLVGNYFYVYIPPGQELYLNQPGDIIVAAVSDVALHGFALPFRYQSDGGVPLWDDVTLDDVTFFNPGPYARLFEERQVGDWPDTLTVFDPLVNNDPWPAGFNPICRLTVTPTVLGQATFETSLVPPAMSPVSFIPVGASDFEVPLVAPTVTVVASCCTGRVGNVNMIGGDEPTIGDIAHLVDHLFMSGRPLDCLLEADINQSGGLDPGYDDLSIGDISALVAYLFLNGDPLVDCP